MSEKDIAGASSRIVAAGGRSTVSTVANRFTLAL